MAAPEPPVRRGSEPVRQDGMEDPERISSMCLFDDPEEHRPGEQVRGDEFDFNVLPGCRMALKSGGDSRGHQLKGAPGLAPV